MDVVTPGRGRGPSFIMLLDTPRARTHPESADLPLQTPLLNANSNASGSRTIAVDGVKSADQRHIKTDNNGLERHRRRRRDRARTQAKTKTYGRTKPDRPPPLLQLEAASTPGSSRYNPIDCR